ncbi:hypothetical protein [Ascidiaceihabitans sp.]|uniref:hypothetical protein n=1 Tax=Ascidiaceihabitans sp. TaxID=1872644 RepID=UPI003296D4DB
MSKARFEIAFEGDPFNEGEIDVRDLAPTLLAFGNVVQAANKALNGDRADARLKVTATDERSFVAGLTMDVGWLADTAIHDALTLAHRHLHRCILVFDPELQRGQPAQSSA